VHAARASGDGAEQGFDGGLSGGKLPPCPVARGMDHAGVACGQMARGWRAGWTRPHWFWTRKGASGARGGGVRRGVGGAARPHRNFAY